MITEFNSNGKRDAALELAEVLGWPVFPCHHITEDRRCSCGKDDCGSPGKHPVGKLAPNGVKQATAEVALINHWWQECPQANPAVATGVSFWALDLDGLEGIRAFNQMAEAHPGLPEVPTAFTGGNGRHLLFAHDDRVHNAAKVGGVPIDVRGQGGYVLVAPSNHISGNTYRWELPPTKYDVEPAPEWLLEFITGGNGVVTTTDVGKFVCEDLDLAAHPGVEEGQRNHMLCRLVGAHLSKHGPDNDLFPLATAWGQRCTPPLPEKQVVKTVAALAEKHVKTNKAKDVPKGKLTVIQYDTIEPQEVTWLWSQRIALGKLTMVSGDPGLGKSFLMVELSARVSTGRDFPDGASCDRGEVLFATLEDGPADTIRPRLDAHDADVARVHHLAGVEAADKRDLGPLQLDRHVQLLRDHLHGHDGVRLLVLDPISAFMGDVDSHKNAEVRRVLAPLAQLAEDHDIAVVAIHLTKSQGKALYRSLGSLAFVAAARAAWIVAADPDDDDRRLFLPAKNNLGRASGLAFRIIDGKVVWEDGPVLIAVDDLDENAETPREEAKHWLQEILADGPVAAQKALKQARADGISERTLRIAKKELRVKSAKSGGGWAWTLPDQIGDEGGDDVPTTWTF